MFDRKAFVHEVEDLVLEVQVHRTKAEMYQALDDLMPEARAALDPEFQGICLGMGGYFYILLNREELFLEVVVHELTHFTLQYLEEMRNRGLSSEPRLYPGTEITEPEGEQVAIDLGVIEADILDWLITDYGLKQANLSPVPVERNIPADDNESDVRCGDVDTNADDDALEQMYKRSNN
jgi:hypothetical protein